MSTETFPDLFTYARSTRCGRCKAGPHQPCVDPNGFATKMHLVRWDAANCQKNRDIGKAPCPEDREPGRCYCSISPCPSNVVQLRTA